MNISPQKYIFFINSPKELFHRSILPKDYNLEIWRPSILKLRPNGLPKRPFLFWSIMHHLGIFGSFDYSIFLVYYNKELIHYTVVLPRYFRFPFMKSNDIQIGPIWTNIEHRNKGIASYVISKIVEIYKKPGRKFWYITRKENILSIELIERLDFLKYGIGFKRDRFLFRFINYFYIENKY